MKEIHWSRSGASEEIFSAIRAGTKFVVITREASAKTLSAHFGAAAAVFTPAVLYGLIAAAAVIGLVGLIIFAFANGYKVTGKARLADGSEYTLVFEPKNKN